MLSAKEIREQISPIDVAFKYLGQPDKKRYGKLWYKSPFRSERTASFMVDEKSFHDFGDSWDGDIFAFVGRYYAVDFKKAMDIIKSDFGIVDNSWGDKELTKYLNEKRKTIADANRALDDWFNSNFEAIIIAQKEWVDISQKAQKDLLKIAYDEIGRLEYLYEIFFDAVKDENKKIQIYRSMKKDR